MDRTDTALEVLAKIGRVDRDALRPEMDLVADLEIDSPKALQLLVELEDRLAIEISDQDAARMRTVGDVVRFVASLP